MSEEISLLVERIEALIAAHQTLKDNFQNLSSKNQELQSITQISREENEKLASENKELREDCQKQVEKLTHAKASIGQLIDKISGQINAQ